MSRRLGKILVDLGYLDEEKLWNVLEEQKRNNDLIGKVAVRLGLVSEDQVLKALAEQLGMKVVKLAELTIPTEALEAINESMASAYKIVPLSVGKKDKSITVAMAEPQNPATLDSLKMFLGVDVKGAIASEKEVLEAIDSPSTPAATRTPSTWRPSRRWPRRRRSASS
jgi:type IV pilus assembly protein PilB